MLLKLGDGLVHEATFDLDEASLNTAVVYHVFPHARLFECLLVADHNEEVLGSRDGHIKSSLVKQEAKTLLHVGLVVRTNAVEDDDVLLGTLEGINCVDVHDLVDQALLIGAELLEARVELLDLSLIWRYDTYFALNVLQRSLETTLSCNEVDQHFGKVSLFVVALRLVVVYFL